MSGNGKYSIGFIKEENNKIKVHWLNLADSDGFFITPCSPFAKDNIESYQKEIDKQTKRYNKALSDGKEMSAYLIKKYIEELEEEKKEWVNIHLSNLRNRKSSIYELKVKLAEGDNNEI